LRERKDSKHVDAGDQVRVKARDRMEIIKMDATKDIALYAYSTETSGQNDIKNEGAKA
jgi:NADH-quinone oxidoreductase subunit J